MTEKEIVAGCKKDNRVCQEAFYEMFYSKVYGICMRYEKNDSRAKDLLQDCFIKMFGQLKKYKGSGSLEGWVRRLVVNSYIDRYRTNSRNPEDLFDFNEGSTQGTSEGGVIGGSNSNNCIESFINNRAIDGYCEQPEEFEIVDIKGINHAELIDMIQSLSPQYRTVFNLYVVEDYSHAEIAEELGISVGTSKSNYSKAKRNLREMLVDKEELIIDYV